MTAQSIRGPRARPARSETDGPTLNWRFLVALSLNLACWTVILAAGCQHLHGAAA